MPGKKSRPPKFWWYRCVDSVKRAMRKYGRLGSPQRICGAQWWHKLSPTKKAEILRKEWKFRKMFGAKFWDSMTGAQQAEASRQVEQNGVGAKRQRVA